MIQIHGWINPKVAEDTGLSPQDLKKMLKALWYGSSGDGSSHSRSKVGQNSILLLQIIYSEPNQKIYGVDKLITLKGNNGKKEEQWRGMNDFELNFYELIEKAGSEKISEIKYYTEVTSIEDTLKSEDKFKKMTFDS